MFRWRDLLVSVIILGVLAALLSGCGGTPEPEPAAQPSVQPSADFQDISNKISGINSAEPAALASLLGVSQEIGEVQDEGAISEEEEGNLKEDLGEKFSGWVRARVNEINPAVSSTPRNFFELQAVQRTGEYSELCDPETKQYTDAQMKYRWNECIRYWVDDIDPTDPDSIKDIFGLQKIQKTAKYDELTTSDTHQYKEEQMGEKVNEWFRNRVDEIDPTDPDSIADFFDLQRLQHTEKYEEFATPETHEYKEGQMKQKFNEWVENRVNALDPNDPNFAEELDKLRVIQLTEKYDRLCTEGVHNWKMRELREKLADLVDAFDPSLPNFMEKLDELTKLQESDHYREIWSGELMCYKEEQLGLKLTREPGEPPHVLGALPEYGQRNVLVDQSILVVFDQPMVAESVEETLEIYPAIEYDTCWLDGDIIMILEPVELWDFDTRYTVYINPESVSEAGLLLQEGYELDFTTGDPGKAPRVTGTLPLDGKVDVSGGEPLEVHFDQPMAPGSLATAIGTSPAISYAILWREDNTIAELHLLEPLGNNTVYKVNIGTGAMSAGYIPLEEGYSFSFITGIVPAPHILGTLPAGGQVDIPSNHPIQVVFSWPMEPASVEAEITVSPAVDYTATWLEANFVLLIEPAAPLASSTSYSIEIGSGAISTEGIPLEEVYSFDFTTG